MTVLERTRKPLYIVRHCNVCGTAFRTRNAVYCSRRHQMRAWRAAAMLAGTHGYVNGQFARLTGVS